MFAALAGETYNSSLLQFIILDTVSSLLNFNIFS
jgi:hypothetical protein